ncbi:hypothetical protein [Gracilibacillus timonensis]|uniref:hypothetical protein n=1 Tax=Gracilibacillus timonensis TaxID=1816696 RepID=UPI000824DC97|nr:hypothetical protein [Gracilibacillus timonensis]
MSYTLILQKEWKKELKSMLLGFLIAILISLYFIITQNDSLLIYVLLWVYPMMVSLIPGRMPHSVAHAFWFNYSQQALYFYKSKVLFRLVHFLLHMLLLSCLNQIYQILFGFDSAYSSWGLQFYIVFLLLYSYLVCLGVSIEEAVSTRNNLGKIVQLLFTILGVVILGIICSWIFDFVFELIPFTDSDDNIMTLLVFTIFSFIQHHINKKLVRQIT